MTPLTAVVVDALQFPNGARVDQRVPKKLLLENGAPSAIDRRLITDVIDDIHWLAALKPNTIGVPEYRDKQREYLEIAVVVVTLRGTTKRASASRITELVHRAIPYPVLLLLADGRMLTLALANKRRAQSEAAKVVLDGDVISVSLSQSEDERSGDGANTAGDVERGFTRSLAISRQSQTSLHAVYQGWIECVQALHAARRTGRYQLFATLEEVAARRNALADCLRLEGEISRLRGEAAKVKQLARQVELNLTIKRIQVELVIAQQQL